MQSDGGTRGSAAAQATPAGIARTLIRTAWKATLSTLDRETGHPYGSLVAVATEPDGTPILLLSQLALHTRNLMADPRASLLFDGTPAGRAALTGARVTAIGSLQATASTTARQRYIARHPAAESFADFGDFGFFRLDVERAHLVAGFGRIERISAEALMTATAGAEPVVAAEASIVQHMNDDHADAVALLAVSRGGASPGPWRMLGCDPDGIDLAAGDAAVRLDFPQRITTAEEARQVLVRLVADARQARS